MNNKCINIRFSCLFYIFLFPSKIFSALKICAEMNYRMTFFKRQRVSPGILFCEFPWILFVNMFDKLCLAVSACAFSGKLEILPSPVDTDDIKKNFIWFQVIRTKFRFLIQSTFVQVGIVFCVCLFIFFIVTRFIIFIEKIRYQCSRIRCSPLWQLPCKILHLARWIRCSGISFADVYNVGHIYANARRITVPSNTVVRFLWPFACWCT